MQRNKITTELLAKYAVYVKIKPIFLKNLRKMPEKKTMTLQKKLLENVWEVKDINADESAFLTNSLLLDGFKETISHKGCGYPIFADEVRIVKVERTRSSLC